MTVLVDTSVWSLAFRRQKANSVSSQQDLVERELKMLITNSQAAIIGPIKQELLSGISSTQQFELLKARINPFENLEILGVDYELAAEFYNRCRQNGIQGGHIDFLICAVALRYNFPIFTTDKDFDLYANHIDILLYTPHEIIK